MLQFTGLSILVMLCETFHSVWRLFLGLGLHSYGKKVNFVLTSIYEISCLFINLIVFVAYAEYKIFTC